ncbi:hypothetical protein DSCO28_65640 [Desulfosarcina ovata subsp. sediminis]|uniref:Cyclic nucleotide-binding domain-containing protein n=1 Tax=Desulfosarcina ovata subsp. sediminis TaxID=885957 RepID=A0A5K8A0V5_9BACT|nr:cyclic nucleotide-binding domain-containing protein [Desulfosarcina ovata]BBO85998.1 hypothetical protein DSCO28_65640 [Desulfosarcina ovata subsp. sediminis]
MVDPALLKSLAFYDDLSDAMIDRLASIAEIREYKEGDFLNKHRRGAKFFYNILDGEISLEFESLTGKIVRLETIVAGGAIGFSSLIEMEEKTYLSDARAISPTRVLRFLASEMALLFYQDFELGFLIMRRIAKIAKRRLMYRTHPIPQILSI